MGTVEQRLCDIEFKEELLFKLNELRKESTLCDATLRIEGQDFAAHRCVLSAASPYFRSLFTSGFKENESTVVELQEIQSAAVASEALRFIYTGEALVDAYNARDLFKVADYLIIPSLKTRVSEYLMTSIDATNCLELESFASQFSCQSLEEATIAFKRENFASVVKSDDFKALGFEKVKELVSHDEIIVSREEEVYEAVISWVKHDIPSRECLLPELLKCLRLFSMSKYSLREILNMEELVIKSRTCTNILHEVMHFFLFPDDLLGRSFKPRACLHSNESVVILTGGHDGDLTATNNTHCFLLSKKNWLYSLPAMPYPRTRHGAAVCRGQLFVIGGDSSDPMCSFNPKENKWISSMETSTLLHCSVSAFNEELYVIGGMDHWNRVDKYDPNLDKWMEVASIRTGRAAHCAVGMGNLIYVLGGCDENDCHRSVECFDPLTEQLTDKPCMTHTRRFAGAAALGRKIFIVGGYADMTWDTLQASCEMFDPVLDQWSLVSSPIVPRAACAMVSFDDHLYLFGGEDTDDKLDSVERYDVQDDKWELFSTMPEKLSCIQASVLLLPKKYIDV